MTIRTALLQGQKILDEAGIAEPKLTAEVLLMHAVSHDRAVDRAWLYAHSNDELTERWWIHYGRYLHERTQGKPTQYITGHQEFYGRDFHVTPDVLIPRPETEHLIEAALAIAGAARDAGAPLRILDIGTGSGAIAVTLALETKARVASTDILLPAIKIAQENARRLTADVALVACDLGAAFRGDAFDLVVSNPPYVPARDRAAIQREVRDFEPPIALYGGDDGLDVYRRLIPEAGRLLKPGGRLLMELGYAQAAPVRGMLSGWDAVEIRSDLAGLPRVALARKPA